MKKTKYNLFLVRGSINDIRLLAKSYDIEFIETNFWGDVYYEFETYENGDEPHPFTIEVSKNEYVVVTKPKDDNQTKKHKFQLAEESSHPILYPPQSALGAYAKEFFYDVESIVGKKIVAIEQSEASLEAKSYNDVSCIMKRLPLLKLSDSHIIALQDIGNRHGGGTDMFIARKEGFADNYPDQKVPSDVTMLIAKGLNIDFNSYELCTKVENLNDWLRFFPQDITRIKKMWQFLEVPFTSEGIWQAFLFGAMWRMLPLKGHSEYSKQTYILDMKDLKRCAWFNKELTLCIRTDLLPHITIGNEKNVATIHYTYWSDWEGLVASKLPVSMDNGVLKWGKCEEDVLIPYNCGTVF